VWDEKLNKLSEVDSSRDGNMNTSKIYIHFPMKSPTHEIEAEQKCAIAVEREIV
jgi:hypothetical protein